MLPDRLVHPKALPVNSSPYVPSRSFFARRERRLRERNLSAPGQTASWTPCMNALVLDSSPSAPGTPEKSQRLFFPPLVSGFLSS